MFNRARISMNPKTRLRNLDHRPRAIRRQLLDRTVQEVLELALVQVSIPILVIPDSTLYQVLARITRGLVQTTDQDTHPRARQLEALQEDILDTRERDIPQWGIQGWDIQERDIRWRHNP